jgi:hypothetical protein
MRLTSFCFLILFIHLTACKNSHQSPVITAPTFPLKVERIDTALFQLDSIGLLQNWEALQKNHSFIQEDFLSNILSLDAHKGDLKVINEVYSFVKAYQPIFQETKKMNLVGTAASQLQQLFNYFHYYFPSYHLPSTIIYFIGPLEGFANTMGQDYMAIGLQMYMGASSPWYQSSKIQGLYPHYISQRFTPDFIPIMAAQNLWMDMQANSSKGKMTSVSSSPNFMQEMIQAGKKITVLQKLLPYSKIENLIGYTPEQWKHIQESESDIWKFILKMNLLYSKDPKLLKNMMEEGPFNIYFGNDIPANVGSYLGYQIVQSWWKQQSSAKQNDLNLLLNMSERQIWEGSKYNQ